MSLPSSSYHESPPPVSELSQELIRARCAEHGEPTLVILDGVTEAMSALGLDPERGTDVANFYGAMPLWFAGTGAAVVMLDHVVKNTTTRGRWATGSQHKISGSHRRRLRHGDRRQQDVRPRAHRAGQGQRLEGPARARPPARGRREGRRHVRARVMAR